MRLHLRRPLLLLGCCLALAAGGASRAQEAPATQTAPERSQTQCIDRLPEADRPDDLTPRLPELVYSCLALADGTHVWMGETGRQHDASVLLVHGLGNLAHRDWRTVIGPLAGRFHVMTLDLPGFGASPAPGPGHTFAQLDQVLEAVVAGHARGGRAHVVGHSLGAALSLHFAHRHPDRVDRLVLVDAAGLLLMNLYTLPKARLTLPQVGVRPVDRVMRSVDSNLNRFGRAVVGRFDHNMDVAGWLRRNPGVRDALFGRNTQVSAALGLAEHDFGPALREMRAPTTLIWGRDDPVAPLRIGRLLEARLHDARLHVIDDAGHAPMTQRPEAFEPLLWSALTEPLPPRQRTPEPTVRRGDVRCTAQLGPRYAGRYGHVQLENCHGVHIADARIDRLTLRNASVTLENVSIVSQGVGIDALRSDVRATDLRVNAAVGVRASGSLLDLAATRIVARERALELPRPSWVYFSVSEIDAPDYQGDAHLAWPVTMTPRR
ncbi:alpha/beta fold hydrolase [Rhizobacter sp. LjRoot28]|uniref:alpha/beta fold hydrolase n=1 Tax=Rhizobacter sp. LjRoot28 TaxID=3342309 RepID=UPI003ED1217F